MDFGEYFISETDTKYPVLPKVIIELSLCIAKEQNLSIQETADLIGISLKEFMQKNNLGILGSDSCFYKTQYKPKQE